MNKKVLNKLKKSLQKHLYCDIMADSYVGEIEEWITSDFYDFNRICSGDLNNCLPAGKTLCIAGKEGSGKSMIIANLFKNAQAMGYIPIIYETEGAWNKVFCINWGVDPENMIYTYVSKIEDLIISLEKLKIDIDAMRAKEDVKFIMGLDSLGNLDTHKKTTDASKNKATLDQGLQARYIKSLFKTINELTVIHQIPFIFSNHLFGNPNSMAHDEDIVGGKAPKLQSDIIAVIDHKPLRLAEQGPERKIILGADSIVKTRKNRFFPPWQSAKLRITFKEGIDSYAGMLDLSIDLGIIQKAVDKDGKEGRKYVFADDPDGPKYWGHELDTPEIYTEELINQINEKIAETGYSTAEEFEEGE